MCLYTHIHTKRKEVIITGCVVFVNVGPDIMLLKFMCREKA